jgi:transposase
LQEGIIIKKKRIEYRPRLPRKPGWRDISDDFWDFIKNILPKPNPMSKNGGHPPVDDYRKLLNGIFYVLRTGCQWKMLPREYYSGSTSHKYFQSWIKVGIFKKMWEKSLNRYDEMKGIKWEWQILDSQTVQSPVKGEKNRSKSY